MNINQMKNETYIIRKCVIIIVASIQGSTKKTKTDIKKKKQRVNNWALSLHTPFRISL
jgi:hypothetical protein